MRVAGVLLELTEATPHGLGMMGQCGARPPVAWQPPPDWEMGSNWRGGYHTHVSAVPHRSALVLAWKTEVIPEGVDHLNRCLSDERKTIGLGLFASDGMPERLVEVWRLALYAERFAGCAVVLVDIEGTEVAPWHKVHECCGCSCRVCAGGHNAGKGTHTTGCVARLEARLAREEA